jgi:hypothetical protein
MRAASRAVVVSSEKRSGIDSPATYGHAMSWCGREQIPNFVMATMAVASFFTYVAGSLGVALAAPITVGLVLAPLRLRVVLAASGQRRGR